MWLRAKIEYLKFLWFWGPNPIYLHQLWHMCTYHVRFNADAQTCHCRMQRKKYQHLCHVWHASNKVIHMTKKPYLLSWELFLLQKGD